MRLRLNPRLSVDSLARIYAADKLVQVEGLFEESAAVEIERALASLPWRLICQDDTRRNVLLTNEQLNTMGEAERRRLEDGIRRRAAQNFGFVYWTYPMIDARIRGWDHGHPIHAVTDFLNSPTFIEFARALIDCPGISKVDAQASNYRAGSFLTRHVDAGEKQERRAAYTIGFTRNWQTDWGGLLMFIDQRFDVSRALKPRFNTLTVFDGLRLHAVSAVAPFAPVPRLSIVGWFRDDPVAGHG